MGPRHSATWPSHPPEAHTQKVFALDMRSLCWGVVVAVVGCPSARVRDVPAGRDTGARSDPPALLGGSVPYGQTLAFEGAGEGCLE
jgi:hypothetical protein